MHLQKSLALLFIFCINSACFGQQLMFTNVSAQLNLPAQETYNVMQDSRGYIWISTEAGLCRYNGTYCYIFDKKNGLPENSTYVVKEDSSGCIWMVTSSNRVLQYTGDSLVEAPFSNYISGILRGTLSQVYCMYFINDSVLLNTQNGSYLGRTKDNRLTLAPGKLEYSFYFIKDRGYFYELKSIYRSHLTNALAQQGIMKLGVKWAAGTREYVFPIDPAEQPSWRVITSSNSTGESFISDGKWLITIHPDLSCTSQIFPQEIISLYSDKTNGLWIGFLKGGVHYFPDSRNMQEEVVSLPDFSVSGVCVDAENGVWCSTLEKGVFYSSNKNVISYANIAGLDKPVDFLKFESGRFFFSVANYGLMEVVHNSILKHPLNLNANPPFTDIIREKEGWIIAGKTIIVKTNDQLTDPVYVKGEATNFYAGVSQLALVSRHRLFGVNFGAILEISGNKSITRKMPLESAGKCLAFIGNNELLYGCKDGLYKMMIDQPDSQNYKTQKVKGLDASVVKILKTSSNDTWIITRENGIYLYAGDTVRNISDSLMLTTDRFADITEDRYGSIWVASNTGLIKITGEAGYFKANTYTKLNGLASNDIYKVAADSNYIYTSGVEGLSQFPLLCNLQNTTPPPVHVAGLYVNGVAKDPEGTLQFEHDSNTVKVELDALCFKEINAPGVYYRLSGTQRENSREGTQKGNVISLENLPPDEYNVAIYAVNNDGVRSAGPVSIQFEVLKPYWNELWFHIAWIGGLALLIYVGARQFAKRIRKREEENTRINKQIADFQLVALQSQMNPHFIFNAINSIQSFILKKKETEAYDYLAKFSKLIRTVLNNSERKILPLDEELETVKLYIELEQLRFEDKFQFELTISPEISPETIELPSMLIQPYVENAIWHGIMNREEAGNGQLKIDVSITDSLLKISIEDNGVGREQSRMFRRHSIHQPVAMNITEKRLAMINLMEDYIGVKVKVTDLHEESGQPLGTRVEIFLPVKST